MFDWARLTEKKTVGLGARALSGGITDPLERLSIQARACVQTIISIAKAAFYNFNTLFDKSHIVAAKAELNTKKIEVYATMVVDIEGGLVKGTKLFAPKAKIFATNIADTGEHIISVVTSYFE